MQRYTKLWVLNSSWVRNLGCVVIFGDCTVQLKWIKKIIFSYILSLSSIPHYPAVSLRQEFSSVEGKEASGH